jgi:hypothetical protein
MDELRRLEAKGLVRARARSRRRRTSIIRSRTIRGSLGLFAIFWAIIFIQLLMGNDPVLGHSSGGHNAGVTATKEARTSGTHPGPEAAMPANAPPEPESERQLEAELAAEREPEWEPEWGAEPAPEPVAPIITSTS